MKRQKYGNRKTYRDSIRFDSIAESRRYMQLMQEQNAGLISDLELQPEFEILPAYRKNGRAVRRTVYRADFRYIRDGKVIVEDVKGVETDVFKLKRKLVEYFYPEITITLVRAK